MKNKVFISSSRESVKKEKKSSLLELKGITIFVIHFKIINKKIKMYKLKKQFCPCKSHLRPFLDPTSSKQ